jgi:hypothetical protein
MSVFACRRRPNPSNVQTPAIRDSVSTIMRHTHIHNTNHSFHKCQPIPQSLERGGRTGAAANELTARKDPHMNVFADAAKVLAALGGLGQQFVGINSPEYEGEYLASSVTSLSADGVAAYYAGKQAFLRQKISRSVREDLTGRLIYDNRKIEKNQRRSKQAAARSKGVSIIPWTLAAVEAAELTTGFWPPAAGADLKVIACRRWPSWISSWHDPGGLVFYEGSRACRSRRRRPTPAPGRSRSSGRRPGRACRS